MQQHIADDDIVISFDGFGGVSVNEAYFCSRCFSRQFSRMSGRMSTMVYEPSMPRPEYAFSICPPSVAPIWRICE